MTENKRVADFITYRTVLDEICRQGRVEEAMRLLQQFQEKDLVDGHAYQKLLCVLEDDYGNSVGRVDPGIELLFRDCYIQLILCRIVSSFNIPRIIS